MQTIRPIDFAVASALAPGWADVLSAATPWRPPILPTVVVVPHPDDEAVMFGGLLAHLARRGADLTVVAVTDGGAAYPDVVDRRRLESIRRVEQTAAVDALGLDIARTVRLGVADGEVGSAEHHVAERVERLLDAHDRALVIAPWVFDHHADHEACGRAARSAVVRVRETGRSVVLAGGLFWSLLRDPAPVGLDLCAVRLATQELDAKRAAIECHRSQVGRSLVDRPVLALSDLEPTRWTNEHYVVDHG